MGQARIRKLAGDYPAKTQTAHVELNYPRKWMTPQLGFEPVALALEDLQFRGITVGGGDCALRHYIAARLLNELGYDCDVVYGAMVARVGHGGHDLVIFGDEDLRPGRSRNGGFLGHYWIRSADGSLADFTVGRWQGIRDAVPGFPPVNWQVRYPAHWWFLPETFPLVTLLDSTDTQGTLVPGQVIYRQFGVGMPQDSVEDLEDVYQRTRSQLLTAVKHNQVNWRGRHLPVDCVKGHAQ